MKIRTKILAMILSLVIAITSLTVMASVSAAANSGESKFATNPSTLSFKHCDVNSDKGSVYLSWQTNILGSDLKSFVIYRAVGNKYEQICRITNTKKRSYYDNAYNTNQKLYSQINSRGNNVWYRIEAECQRWNGSKYSYWTNTRVVYIRPPVINYQWKRVNGYLNVTLKILRTMGTPEIYYTKSKNGRTAYTGWKKCNLKGTFDKKSFCDVYKDVAKGLKKGEYIKYRIRYKYQGISASKYTDTFFIN